MASFWKKLFPWTKDDDAASEGAWRVELENGLTIITAVDKPTPEESIALITHLSAAGLYHRRIYDLSQIEFPFTMRQLRKLAIAGREIITGENRIAIVVKDDVGYGSVRAFLTQRESETTVAMNVFRSLDDAKDWMGNDGNP